MTRPSRAPSELQSGASQSAWLTRRATPLASMDDVLLVLRRASFSQLARGCLSDLPLLVVGLSLYDVERVERLHIPRLGFAVAFVLAFWFRL